MGLTEWRFTDEPLDDKTISEVENLFGVKLPEDYKQCIKENNGGYPQPKNFDWDDGSKSVFDSLISFTHERLNIKMFLDKFESLKIFPFATDPFGNLICFDYRYTKNSPIVVFYDHEEDTIQPICNSFTALVERLYE